MQINKIDLLKRGWSTGEIEHASAIIEEAENKKHISLKFFEKTIYWTLLLLLIIGNAICATFLIPFLFVFKGNFIIFIVTTLGLIIGILFSVIIIDIVKKEKKYLRNLLIALILSGVVSFGLISKASIEFSALTLIPLRHNPYLIAGIYLFSFLTPHAVMIIKNNQTTK